MFKVGQRHTHPLYWLCVHKCVCTLCEATNVYVNQTFIIVTCPRPSAHKEERCHWIRGSGSSRPCSPGCTDFKHAARPYITGAQRTEREEATDFLQSPSRASLNSVRSFTRPHHDLWAVVTRDLRGTYSEHRIVHLMSLSSMELWYHRVWRSHYEPICSPRFFSLPITFCPLCTTASHTYHLYCSSLHPPVQRPSLYHRPLLCNPSPHLGKKTGGKELSSSRTYLL